jgi:hypothetical protein
LLVLTDEGDNQTVSLVDPVNDTWTQVATGQISGLVKPAGDTAFYWYQGECTAEAACEENTIWTNGPDGPIEYLANTNFTMAQNGQSIAWVESTEDPTQILYTSSVDKTNQDFLYLPGNRAVDLEWSPDSTSVVLLSKTRDDYTGKSGDARIFLVNTTTMSQTEFYAFPGLTPSVIWSAGAGQLFLTSTLPTDDGYQLHFRQMDLGSGLFDNLDNSLSITSPDFITLDKIYWITP